MVPVIKTDEIKKEGKAIETYINENTDTYKRRIVQRA